ncbi:MAG: TonB-dependent receptor plug domain-containing protein, partial [Deltaproteobacteria bacterium]
VNAEYDHTDGFRQNSATDQNSASAKLTYAPNDDNKLSLNTGYFNSRLGTPGMKSMPDNDDRQLDYKNFVDGSWAFDAGEGLSFLNRGYRNYEKLRFFENTAGSMWDIAGDTFRHTTVSNGFDSQVTKEFNDVYTVTGGFNYVGNFNNSTTSGKHSYNVRAGYLQNILKVTERTTLQVGGRVDDYSNFGTQFDPNAGVIYAFNKTDRLRASVSRSFRAPTFNELFWPDQGWAKGNPNLRPEKSVNMDAGFDKKVTERWSTSVTYFHNRFRDLINWVTDSSWVSQPVNIGSAQIDGIEFGNKVTLTEKLKFLLDYTYQRPLDRQTRKDLVYEPRHKLNSTLKYEVAGATVRLNGVYSNTRFVSADNTMKAKQYFVLNLGLTKALSPNVDFLLNLNNLLNRKYEVVKEFPEPGFTVLTGVKATF